MIRETVIFVALVVVGAGWPLVHVALLIRTARAPGLRFGMRLLAWLPPATPIVSWRAGARVLPVLWIVNAAIYVALRSVV